jgi:hypothetical protein
MENKRKFCGKDRMIFDIFLFLLNYINFLELSPFQITVNEICLRNIMIKRFILNESNYIFVMNVIMLLYYLGV